MQTADSILCYNTQDADNSSIAHSDEERIFEDWNHMLAT
jgi:hypothetical protein